ncbi:MAG: ATP-binding protein [Candidatus Methanosuratincola sp.]
MKISKKIALGYILMLIIMSLVGGFSVYNIYRLDKAATNVKGRYEIILGLLTAKARESGIEPDLFNLNNEMLAESIRISDMQLKYSYLSTFAAMGIALLFGGILAFTLPRVITRPIFRLVEAAKGVAAGDYSQRVEEINQGDEVSTLIRAFNNMIEHIELSRRELEVKHSENLALLEATKRFNETLQQRIEEATREIREKQEELIRAERLATIGEMATGIAHEIRNPLSGMYLALESMKRETASEEHRETIEDILEEIERLEHIIKELLLLGRPRSLNLVECNPNEVVERAVSLVGNMAKERGIEVVKRLACSEEIRVDPEQLEQVVLNLLINAIEAIEGEGRITVETAWVEGSFILRVIDTGSGMTEEEKASIFRPFYSTKRHGTGLGLSISNSIVENHGGRITVSSKKGEGSIFTVRIPQSRDCLIS